MSTLKKLFRQSVNPSIRQSSWLISPRFDLGLFVAPGLLSILILLVSPHELLETAEMPVWGWVLFIVMIDVGHVYASLYRTYFDVEEYQRRRSLYLGVPAVIFLIGVVLYTLDAVYFWRVLAYAAVIHFIRQQYGFMALYKYRAGERDRREWRLDRAVLYMSMLYPVAYWHTHLPRKFVWFIEGDFLSIPVQTLVGWAGVVYLLLIVAYIVKEGWYLRRGRPLNPGKHLILMTTALVWYIGIVHYNSDYSFTVTNVVTHGVPYMALVWIYCRRKWGATAGDGWMPRLSRPAWVGVFVGILLCFAFVEEWIWDLLVWGEHASVFGGWSEVTLIQDASLLALIVPLLSLPQATHYVLDAFIWKLNASNPDLKVHLFDHG